MTLSLLLNAAQLLDRAMPVIMRVLSEGASEATPAATVTPPVSCARCGSEPWVIRWGTLRIAQELDGYFYLATVGDGPLLVCRDCYHAALGIQDPAKPEPARTGAEPIAK